MYNGCTQEGFSQSVTAYNQVSGFCYDGAGNLLAEGSCPGGPPYTYNYDAENHLTSTAGVAYTYDGDGERVEKSNGEIYWYTSGGEVLDETDLSGNLTSEYIFFGGARIARRDASGNVFYYLADHLGSSRVMAEIPSGQTTATLCYDADFYPFGGERAYTNSCQQNYKFTGKERDPESGLDNFEARYYGSSIGRFTSPDDPFVGWQLNDPQSLNLYAYVQDNPINDVDPTGQDCTIVNGGSVMQCGFSTLENAQDTNVPCEGWSYIGLCVPAPDTTGIAANNNVQTAAQKSDTQTPKPTDPKPAPTDANGKPTPPPVPVPGCPKCEWQWNRDDMNPRGGTWGPKGWKGPNPPNGSWDPNGHWDINDGKGSPVDHYDPGGRPLTPDQAHPGPASTQERSSLWDKAKSIAPGPVARAGTAAIIIYLIVSEGTRVYLPRDFVPVP